MTENESETPATDMDYEDVIVDILNHRKKIGGPYEVLTEWDDRSRIWTTIDNCYVDAKQKLREYTKNNKLIPFSYFFSSKEAEEKMVKKNGGVQPSKKKLDNKATLSEIETKCNHEDFDMGQSYRMEENQVYCGPTGYLYEYKCASCGADFVDKGKSEKGKQFRPKPGEAAYICIHYNSINCRHGLCYGCFSEKMTVYNATNGRSRRNNK